ncbi:hypothetical protein PAMP_009794 [Pampus punctatissimus]
MFAALSHVLSPPTSSCEPSPFTSSLSFSLRLCLSLLVAFGGQEQDRTRTLNTHSTTTDMSDSETAAAPVEAPVPAACATIKADLDKCVAEKGAEGCKDLMEAFAACVKSAAEGTS